MSDLPPNLPADVANYLRSLNDARNGEHPVSTQPVPDPTSGVNWDAINAMLKAGYKANPDGTITDPSGNTLAGSTGGNASTVVRQAATSKPTTQAPAVDFATQANLLFPYLPDALRQVFVDAWTNTGDVNLALQTMRESPIYQQYYAGNRRADGTIRMSEADYASTIEGYRRRLASYGVNPDDFKDLYVQNIENDKSAIEFGNDLDKAYLGVLSNAPAVRDWYAQNFGAGDLSTTAFFHSYLDPTVSPLEAEKRITTAQIGGEASMKGLNVSRTEAEQLASYALNQDAARNLFSQVAGNLPVLQDLQQRFNDNSDPLTADEYANALVLKTPEDLLHVARLVAQNQSLFSPQGTFAPDRNTGGIPGLTAAG